MENGVSSWGDGYTISTLSKAKGVAETTESGFDFILVSFPENHYRFQENPHCIHVPFHQRLIKTELFGQLCGSMALKSAWRGKGSGKSPDVRESKRQHLWSFPGLSWKVLLLPTLSASYVPTEAVCHPRR